MRYLTQADLGTPADTQPRLSLQGSATPKILFGAGGSSTADVEIKRSASAGILEIDVNGTTNPMQLNLRGASGQGTVLALWVVGESNPRLMFEGDTGASSLALGPGGAVVLDAYIRRSAAKTLIVDTDGAGGSLTTVDFKTTNFWVNGSPITATATQVSLDTAAAATTTYVARAKETGDTAGGTTIPSGYRVWMGVDANDRGALFFGQGGTNPMDIFIYRSASKVLNIDGDGAGGSATLQIGGEIDLVTDWTATLPTTPTTGVKIYARYYGNRWLGVVPPSGIDYAVAPAIWVRWSSWIPDGNGTNVRITRGPTQTVVGTTTTMGAVATTSYVTALGSIIKVVSATTAGSFSEWRGADNRLYMGNAAGKGGFTLVMDFNVTTAASASDRYFWGASTTTGAFANSDPSALLNLMGVAADAGDTNLQFIHNDGAGVATKVDLGANFPKAASATNWFRMMMNVDPNSTTVSWVVVRLDDLTKTSQSGTFSTDMPSVNVLMNWHAWASNNATAAATAIGNGGIYVGYQG